jgi:serine/threonine protein kinase
LNCTGYIINKALTLPYATVIAKALQATLLFDNISKWFVSIQNKIHIINELDKMSKRFAAELARVTFLGCRLDTQLPKYSITDSQSKTTYNYSIGDILGEGSYGQVKIGVEESTGQVVAIKKLYPRLQQEAQRFFQAKLLDKGLLQSEYLAFNHANSLQQFATCHYGQDTMVTPFINGEKLFEDDTDDQSDEDEKVSKKYTANHWFDICSQLTEQIRKLHAKGITHGDFDYGNNVLISPKGVNLLDFGLAVVQSDSKASEEEKDESPVDDSQPEDKIIDTHFMNPIFKSLTDSFHIALKNYLTTFLFDKDKNLPKPFAKFLFSNPKQAKQLVVQVKESIKLTNTSSAFEMYKLLAPILLKIIHSNLSAKELMEIDRTHLQWYSNELGAELKDGIKLINEAKLFESSTTLLTALNSFNEKGGLNDLKSKLQDEAKKYISSLFSQDKIRNLIYHTDLFSFSLSLLPILERLNILDLAYKNCTIFHNGNIDQETLKSISNLYFSEYRRCAKRLDTDERIKLIENVINLHRIPSKFIEQFEKETDNHYAFAAQELIMQFNKSPDTTKLIYFLKLCSRFYSDSNQFKKQARQAALIIFHIFTSESDEKQSGPDNEQEKALAELRHLAFNKENKSLRKTICHTYFWIERTTKLDDLQDVKTNWLKLKNNSESLEDFIKEENKVVEELKKQEQFRARAISRIEEDIHRINRSSFFFKDSFITQSKTTHLEEIKSLLNQKDFTSIGQHLDPKTLMVRYPDLFNPRHHLLSTLTSLGRQNSPPLTKTYEAFKELSASYNQVLSETQPTAR